MRKRDADMRFYLAAWSLAAAFGLFFLSRENLPELPPPVFLAVCGGAMALFYLFFASRWALEKCAGNNYSYWLAPLSGGLAGLVLGVGLEIMFLQGSAIEGAGVNGCLAAGAVVSMAVCFRNLFGDGGQGNGRSGRIRRYV